MAKATPLGVVSYGEWPCTCCCGSAMTEHTSRNCLMGQMACTHCGCRKALETPVIMIRVYHAGPYSVESMKEFVDNAVYLGASEDAAMNLGENGIMHIDIPAETLTNKQEIARIKKSVVRKSIP